MDPETVETPTAARAAEVARALEAYHAPLSGPARGGPAKVRYTHDAMIDIIIANPAISQGELSTTFGYSQGWVSIVVNSDAFKARLEQRKEELVDPTLRLTLNERFKALVTRSLDVLQEKLSRDPAQVPDNLALRAVELGSKALGLGGHAPPPPPPIDHLSTLAERLLALQGKARTRPSEVLEYDEGSAAFEPVPAHQPHPAGPSAGQGEATDVCAKPVGAPAATQVHRDEGQGVLGAR